MARRYRKDVLNVTTVMGTLRCAWCGEQDLRDEAGGGIPGRIGVRCHACGVSYEEVYENKVRGTIRIANVREAQ
jgi:hypothetical protein